MGRGGGGSGAQVYLSIFLENLTSWEKKRDFSLLHSLNGLSSTLFESLKEFVAP